MNISIKDTNHIPTGFYHYDMISGGFAKGELIVLGGRPGIGKTNLMINLCSKIARLDYSCAFITLELSSKQLIKRFLNYDTAFEETKSSAHGIDMDFFSLPFWIFDNHMRTNFNLIKLCKLIVCNQKLDIIFIDYFQLIDISEKRSTHGAQLIIEELKLIAKEFDIAIVIASSLSKEIDSRPLLERRPQLIDLLKLDANDDNIDEVLFLYRNDYYGIKKEENAINRVDVELIIAKKSSGYLDTIHLKLDKSRLVYEDNLLP